jgi:signal transduction histidine kinase
MIFKPLSRWRFSRQLSIVVSIAILGLALFSSVSTSWEARRRMNSYLLEQGQQIAQNLARQSVLALLFGSPENAELALKTTLAFPDVLEVSIIDLNGKVLAHQRKTELGPTPPMLSSHSGMTGESADALYFTVPVLSPQAESSPYETVKKKDTVLGQAHVVLGKGSLNRLAFSLFISNLSVTLAFAAILLWLIRRLSVQVMRPLDDLSKLMRRAENGESNMRALPSGPRDIVEMGQAFNKMMIVLEEREFELEQTVQKRTRKLEQANDELGHSLNTVKNMQSELVRSEKMAALGSLVAGVSHELNTPIGNCVMVASTIKYQIDSILTDLQSGTMRRSTLEQHLHSSLQGVSMLELNLARAAELIGSFKRVAVDRTSDHRRGFDLRLTLTEILITSVPMYKATPYKMETELAEGIVMDSYPGSLGQVITNFISNALAHAFEGRANGTMCLRSRALDDDSAEISFSDDGVGIAPQHQRRVFDPFFTTKLGQGGSGLGMNITYNIVTEVLGGSVTLSSSSESGTTFRLILPRKAPLGSDAGACAA